MRAVPLGGSFNIDNADAQMKVDVSKQERQEKPCAICWRFRF